MFFTEEIKKVNLFSCDEFHFVAAASCHRPPLMELNYNNNTNTLFMQFLVLKIISLQMNDPEHLYGSQSSAAGTN